MKRFGAVIKVKSEKLQEYKDLHANAWPGILDMLKQCNISNYSIYYRDGYLFSYLEYTGTDYKGDMEIMNKDPLSQKWWKLTSPCQQPLPTCKEGQWWANMEEVFHLD